MKLNKNEIKKIVSGANKIDDLDYSQYVSGRSSNGGCYVYGTTYNRTTRGWVMDSWTSCDMVEPTEPEFINDAELAHRLSGNYWDQEDYILIIDGQEWSKSHPANKMSVRKFRRANLDNEFNGWNNRLALDICNILLAIEIGGSVSMQKVEYGWIHEYTRTRSGWHYHRHGNGEINEPDRDVTEAEVFHYLYDAMEDYPYSYHSIWVGRTRYAKPRDVKPSHFLDQYFKAV